MLLQAPADPTGKRKPGSASSSSNPPIRRGWLSVQSGSGIMARKKEHWFVLTTDALQWYKDEDEKDLKVSIATAGCKVEDMKDKLGNEITNGFRIFNPESKRLYKDHDSLECYTLDHDEKTAWQASLLRSGIYPVNEDAGEVQEQDSLDPQLESQVETIRNLVSTSSFPRKKNTVQIYVYTKALYATSLSTLL